MDPLNLHGQAFLECTKHILHNHGHDLRFLLYIVVGHRQAHPRRDETEGQLILNGSYNINFTMDLEVKDLGLFDELGRTHDVPLELSPLCVDIMKDGLARYGPRAWSSMVVRRLEDDCGVDLRAPGFPEYLTDSEPEQAGTEVLVRGRDDSPVK